MFEFDGDEFWALTRFKNVFAAAVDAKTFSSAQGSTLAYGDMENLELESPIVMMDPPDHTALRKLVIKRFTLKQVMAIEPLVPTFVVERVERLREAWEGDAVIELFKPLPSLVAGHFFGVPEADRSLFDGWTDATVTANANGDITAAGDAAGARHVLQPADRASSKRARRRHDLGSGACKTGRVRSVPGQDSGFCLHHGDRGQ